MILRRSSALLCGTFLLYACSAGNAATFVFTDPQEDPSVPFDIQSVTITLSPDPFPTDVIIEASFFGEIAPPSDFLPNSLFGYLEFDFDQNPLTGESDFSGVLGIPPSGLGVDLLVDLNSEEEGVVDLLNSDLDRLTFLFITFTPTSFSLSMPLWILGDERFDFRLIVGTFPEPTDEIMGSTGTGSVIPEPTSALCWLGLLGVVGLRGAVRRRVRREA